MSERTPSKAPGDARVAILRIIATALSGVCIAVVGIIPQLSAMWSNPEERWKITGAVIGGEDTARSELFLIPQEYRILPDDNGKFAVDNVTSGPYQFVVGQDTVFLGEEAAP